VLYFISTSQLGNGALDKRKHPSHRFYFRPQRPGRPPLCPEAFQRLLALFRASSCVLTRPGFANLQHSIPILTKIAKAHFSSALFSHTISARFLTKQQRGSCSLETFFQSELLCFCHRRKPVLKPKSHVAATGAEKNVKTFCRAVTVCLQFTMN